MKVWGENGFQTVVTTSGAGLFEVMFQNHPIDGKWFVQMLENDQPASDTVGFFTSAGGCGEGTGKQRFKVEWQRVR